MTSWQPQSDPSQPSFQPYGSDPSTGYGNPPTVTPEPYPYTNPTYSGYTGASAYPNQGLSPYQVAAAMDHPQATTIFVLGLLSIVMMPILGIVALVMGKKARAEVQAGTYRDSSMLNAGWIMGIIGTLLLALGVVIFTIYFIAIFVILTTP